MAESIAKRLKPNPVVIGTHSGAFHADEALAVHMLRMLPAYQDASLVRSRDPAALEACHVVVDVGGEYDPARNRFDHHQRGFTTTFPGRATKLSSAGLVYLHFGRAIIARQLARANAGSDADAGVGVDADTDDEEHEREKAPEVEKVWNKFYEAFVEAIDANDNGISPYDPDALAAAGIEKRFSTGGITLGSMVNRFNAPWNEPVPSDPAEARRAEDERFGRASARMGEEFEHALGFYVRSWLPAREIVQAAWARRREFDPEGRAVVFDGQPPPWKDHLYTIEKEEDGGARALYVLYPEKPVPDAKWRIQAVPEEENSFRSRKPLPEAWRGFRDEALDRISGVDGCVFVHASGFIGGNETFEGVKAMLVKALEA